MSLDLALTTVFVALTAFALTFLWVRHAHRPPPIEPRTDLWEVSLDPDGRMARVRWAVPDAGGRHVYVKHYPTTGWGRHAAERAAARWNAAGITPQNAQLGIRPPVGD